jgi:hypothetical protein
MTTALDLVNECHRYLLPTAREPLNVLSGSHTNSQTTLTFAQDSTAVNVGSTISVDLELMYVWSVNTPARTCVVQRGMQGSTAATHADQALVTVNPRFSNFSILQAINADLDDLGAPSNGLFQTGVIEFTYQPQIAGYDLTAIPANYLNVLTVRYDTPGPWKDWPELRHWQVKKNQDVTDFASGTAIMLYDAAYPGRDVRVTYSYPFTHFTTTADDITTVAGLAATMADIPPLGAAARLAGVRETQRNQFEAQGDTRRATEVPPNSQLAGATQLMRLRQSRISAEAARLNTNYPTRRRG